jgi:hypothetical protein
MKRTARTSNSTAPTGPTGNGTSPATKHAAPTSKRHLRPRTAITSGAALGLVVGATVYGAVSSSADAPIPQTLKAKAPAAVAPVMAAGCTGTAKLEKGVCVVHVVRTVIAPLAASAAPPAAAPVAGNVPSSTVRPGTPAGGSAAAPKTTVAPKAPATPVAPKKAPVPVPVAAVAPAPKPSPTKTPVPGSTPTPTPTPVPTAAS